MNNSKSFRVFHFNASEQLSAELAMFASKHNQLKSKEFKKAWNEWTQMPEIMNLVQEETRNLLENGFQGDALEKIYFSARYYYRKKSLRKTRDYESESRYRKKYERSNKELLESINRHIAEQDTASVSPAKAFELFCLKIANTNTMNNEKLKKIYKNRFFVFRKSRSLAKI